MQVLNVALGGTLDQHLPDSLGRDSHRVVPGEFGEHEVRVEPGSLAARVCGGERFGVLSHHHQGLAELADGLRASGWDAEDGTIEAVEAPGRRFALGVIWHPEEDENSPVVGSLVEAARMVAHR
jgi:putative glutamine amidotransferase